MKIPCVVIGGGLSGLAAAIRLARFIPDVVLLEQHSRLGGLNSYYYRNRTLFETGLHAITNYAEPGEKRAPLNRLFRQLKLNRKNFTLLQQKTSEVHFYGCQSLLFSNDFNLLENEIAQKFPNSIDGFIQLVDFMRDFDPFVPLPFRSTRQFLAELIKDPLLIDMLLCPLMYYGSSVEDDMDLSQFTIMFQAIFLEGMFRPEHSIKEFLDSLKEHFESLGGTIRLSSRVKGLTRDHKGKRVSRIILESGDILEADFIISTAGYEETFDLLDQELPETKEDRLGFIESIYQFHSQDRDQLPSDRTVIFYNSGEVFNYRQPQSFTDFNSGVICFPFNFENLVPGTHVEMRSTHLASYRHWKTIKEYPQKYLKEKETARIHSRRSIEKIVGKLNVNVVYEDTFTPLTIERYTAKKNGAIYGSPKKIKDGDIGLENLFLAGTDQGFLGIVGSMLSGVSIVNQHVLSRF
ncbi:NAD(P)/FAD-dependent oxidoreductase [Desulfopila sp. IMCC35008]|uniref:phytoene desaturase family protein n=1 Tax=Desulfopila sp. IMCC35008 TaxID=2653858 RepID=UPI0013D0E18E|nr:NAD(P)/FAD-dependent oxidoreductase [Desulfopila sp. IMCC35008]